MTNKSFVMTPQGAQKQPGWFSWRHETREAHDAASLRWLTAHPAYVAKHRGARARLLALTSK